MNEDKARLKFTVEVGILLRGKFRKGILSLKDTVCRDFRDAVFVASEDRGFLSSVFTIEIKGIPYSIGVALKEGIEAIT